MKYITEEKLRVRDSWITNRFLDPTNQKFVKLPFFKNHFFRNIITLNKHNEATQVCQSVYLPRVEWMRLTDSESSEPPTFCILPKLCELCKCHRNPLETLEWKSFEH